LNTNPIPASNEEQAQDIRYFSPRGIFRGLVITILGFLIFLLGARPSFFGLDRSPVIGFVQLSFITIGLGILCLGGYFCLKAVWKDRAISIAADIGVRMVATGYVIAAFCVMADVFGFGSQVFPSVPYFGPIQAGGVMVGQGIISVGFLLLIPFNSRPNKAA